MESSLSLPEFVTKEFDDYLQYGILTHEFLRAKYGEISNSQTQRINHSTTKIKKAKGLHFMVAIVKACVRY